MTESNTTVQAVYGKPLFPVVGLASDLKKGATISIATKEGKVHERKVERVLFTEDRDGQKIAHALVTKAA